MGHAEAGEHIGEAFGAGHFAIVAKHRVIPIVALWKPKDPHG
jgi:hypothetical protein